VGKDKGSSNVDAPVYLLDLKYFTSGVSCVLLRRVLDQSKGLSGVGSVRFIKVIVKGPSEEEAIRQMLWARNFVPHDQNSFQSGEAAAAAAAVPAAPAQSFIEKKKNVAVREYFVSFTM
jgi:hypothetical protein